MAKQDSLQKARERYDDATEAFSEQRRRMVEDLRFSNPADLQQWDQRIRQARENAPGGARPCMTFDQTNQYIQNVVNDFRQNKPQINAIPSTGGNVKVAEAISGIIRHLEYESRASIAYDTAVEYAARIGRGWARIVPELIDDEYNLQTIRVQRIHDPLCVKPDPNYIEPDGSDQTHGFIESIMSLEAFKAKYPKKQTVSWEKDTADWFKEDSVRICEYFEQEESKESRLVIESPDGQRMTVSEDEYWNLAKKIGFKPNVIQQFTSSKKTVKWTKMSGAEELEDPTTFPSKWIPLIPFHGTELWVEGKRYLSGMVRPMMDGQRAVNFAASSDIELVTQQPKAPYLAAWEAIAEFEAEWKGMNSSNAAYLPYNAFDADGNPVPMPSRQAPPQGGAAYGRMTEQAMGFIKSSIGNYGSNLGAPSNAISGRAKLADERQGDTANYHYQDNAARSIEHLGRIIVDMFPVVFADTSYGPRDMQTLGLDGTSDVVTIDPEMADHFQQKGKRTVSINPTSGTYSVRIKVGPAFASLRAETADSLTKIVQSSPQLMGVLGPMWARMQDWPEAEKVSKLLLAIAPPQVQALEGGDEEVPPQAQAQLQQLQEQVKQLSQALEQAHSEHMQLEGDVKSRMSVEQLKAQSMSQMEAQKHAREIEFEHVKAMQTKEDNDAKMSVAQANNDSAWRIAELNAKVALAKQQTDAAQATQAREAEMILEGQRMKAQQDSQAAATAAKEPKNTGPAPELKALLDGHAKLTDAVGEMAATLAKPRMRIPVRDKAGVTTHVIDKVAD